jgi:hypothetical protein
MVQYSAGSVSEQASDLARLLEEASPDRAFDFALGMHERACRGADQTWIDLWHEVVTILKGAGQPAMPSPAGRSEAAASVVLPATSVTVGLSGAEALEPLPVVPPARASGLGLAPP